ncbi:hypothetical protein R3P38DRAFT_2566896 [Favolaschia claudopus]|uniref:Uncharacterized protein n=1 Tax=Favolaschia claudopus TaxID=2862362 RepID=A0AAV9ZXL5_9AGAR
MSTQTVTGFSPNVFTFSNDTTLTIDGTNLTQTSSVVWIQFRDSENNGTPVAQNYSFKVPASTLATTATVIIPANIINYYADSYQMHWAVANPGDAFADFDWHSNSHFPIVYMFDITIGGDMVPAAGGLLSAINLVNVPEQVTATVSLAPRNVRATSWDNTAGKAVPASVQATLQIIDAASGTGIIPFIVPKLSWEGQWDITLEMTVSGMDGVTLYTSPAIPVPGPGLIAYTSILGSQTDTSAPSVPTMGVSCTFSAVNPAPATSLLNQHLRDNRSGWPDWLLNQPTDYTQANGYGDLFVYTDDVDENGNYTPFFIDGVAHYLLDEANLSIQLVDLSGSGRLVNGTPIAIRVFDQVKGWRCARMAVNNLTYTTVGQYPTRWVVDSTSKEYPSKPEEIFGIYQLCSYVPNDDQGNFNKGAAPCIIETNAANLINFGIDKVILVPGTFLYPIDPYFVSSALPTVNLQPAATPSQSLVWGAGGFTDGFSVDASVYSVFFTGYINYAVPTDAMATARLGPSLNSGEVISSTCIGSTAVIDPANPGSKYLLMVASDPAVTTRPQNLFYILYKQGQTPGGWKPLMSNTVAFNTNGASGQVSIVQVTGSDTVLLFQRSAPNLVAVFPCTINFSQQTLQLTGGGSAAQPNGSTILLASTVTSSVIAAYALRFGITLQDVSLVNGSRFNVLYQPAPGSLGSSGYHIFIQPQGLESTLIHLWYPTISSAPFIDESKGTCLGIYGTVEKAIATSTSSNTGTTAASQSPSPPLQICTGNLGSKVDLVIDSVTYGGTIPLFIEVKAIQNGGTWTYGVREWSSFGTGAFNTAASYAISTDKQTLYLSTGATDILAANYGLTLHFQPTDYGASPTTIDTSQLVNGDTWIFEILPYEVTALTSGTANTGTASLVVDASGLKMPSEANFSCQFDLVYQSSSSHNSLLGKSFAVQNRSGPFYNSLVPALQYPLDSNWTAQPNSSSQHLSITITGTPSDGDRWTIVLTNGRVSPVVAGTVNTGAWGYPTISGTFPAQQQIQVAVTCTAAGTVPEQVSFQYTAKPINSTGATGSPIVSDAPFTLSPITVPNSAGVQQLVGWSTFDLTFGILEGSLTFGFKNISGLPAVNDTWTFIVQPSSPVIERIGQRPVAAFSQSGSYGTACIIVPTYSAGGRFLQLQIPIQLPGTQSTLPKLCSLLSLRSTLEPHIVPSSSGNTIFFKGLSSPGLSWSDGIKKEVSTDAANEILYGLQAYLGMDYRPAHSGLIYSATIPASGLSDTTNNGVISFSTLGGSDLITEPQMEAAYVQQLPPAGWTVDPLSTTLPAYKPTGWFAIFPQYRFRVGQVQVIADFAAALTMNAASVSAALQVPIVGASGRQILNEMFFVQTLIPVNRTDVFQQYQSAVGTQMSRDSNFAVQDGSGNPVNPFNNTAFYESVVYNPAWATDTDYDNNLSKYLMQLSVLRQTWENPPAWTIATTEGRTVDAYWRFRLGGPTCDTLLTQAYAGACYQNKYNTVTQTQLPKYYSTDPIWINTFGSAAAAAASVMLDSRLSPSFQQLTSTDQATLVNAITQGIGSGGTSMLQIVMMYLASQAILSSNVPLTGVNTVSNVPVTVKSTDPNLPPQSSDVTVNKTIISK